MRTFPLITKTPNEIVFANREALEGAWSEWKGGNDVILTWKEGNELLSEVVTPSILKAFAEGIVRCYSQE